MNDSLLMEEINCQQKLLHYYLGFCFAYFALIINVVKQSTAFLVVEDKINVFAIFENFKESKHAIALLEDPVYFNFRDQVSECGRSSLNSG